MSDGNFYPVPPSVDCPALLLATRAPLEIPYWFSPEGVRAKPEWPEGLLPESLTRCRLPEYEAFDRVLSEWEREWAKARMAQWPWAYARMVLDAWPKDLQPFVRVAWEEPVPYSGPRENPYIKVEPKEPT